MDHKSGSKAIKKYKMTTDLTDEKLDEVAKYLKETILDVNAQIIFEPCANDSQQSSMCIMEIELFGENYRHALDEIAHFLVHVAGLNVMKAIVEEPDQDDFMVLDYSVFYCCKKKKDLTLSKVSSSLSLPVPTVTAETSSYITPQFDEAGRATSTESFKEIRDISAVPSAAPDSGNPNSAVTTIHRVDSNRIECSKMTPDNGVAMSHQFESEANVILPGGYNGIAHYSAQHIISSQSLIHTIQRPEVFQSDCDSVRREIKAIFAKHDLPGCDAFVRITHENAVVYDRNKNVKRGDTFTNIDLTNIDPTFGGKIRDISDQKKSTTSSLVQMPQRKKSSTNLDSTDPARRNLSGVSDPLNSSLHGYIERPHKFTAVDVIREHHQGGEV